MGGQVSAGWSKKQLTCKRCGSLYLLSKSGRYYYCRTCARHYARLHFYGVTKEQFETMLKKQDGKCAICGQEQTETYNKGRALCVDHDKETKAVRGLLCANCNLAIGHLKHDITLLDKAIDYLKEYEK